MSEAGAGSNKPRRAGPLQVAKAVLWSFFGIRRSKDQDRDAVTITPLQIIVAGLIGAALLVVCLILVVRLVTS